MDTPKPALTAAQKAYALLWRTVSSEWQIHAARIELRDSLTGEERRAAIQWVVAEFGPMSTNEVIAADMQAGVFPQRSIGGPA